MEALQQQLASLSFNEQAVQQQEDAVAAEAEAVQRCRNSADSLAGQLGGVRLPPGLRNLQFGLSAQVSPVMLDLGS